MITDETAQQMESLFVKHLHGRGKNRTNQRITVFHVFLNQEQPISAQNLLYAVKRVDVMISFHVLYDALRVMKSCGLAREIKSERKRAAILYAPVSLTPTTCGHQHLVCKDCGAVIEHELESQTEVSA